MQLVKREIASRYKGSYLGFLWSFIVPLSMLAIYTFVFADIFHARWSIPGENRTTFAVVLFCGLVTFNVFAEVMAQAPSLIIKNTNLVKKVVFPLHILPTVLLLSSLINFAVGMCIVVLSTKVLLGVFHWTVLFIPLVLLPLGLLALGIGWFLSSLGVFLRDIGQLTPVLVQGLMFMTPIFYPVTSFPPSFRFILYINPLSYVVDNMRRVTIWGTHPNWLYTGIGTLVGLTIAVAGAIWFERTRGGFADVL